METWTGIVSGTNRGLIIIHLDLDKPDQVTGNFNLYDIDTTSLSGKIQAQLKDNHLLGKIHDIVPAGEAVPTEGNIDFVISHDHKEMKGKWSTSADTKGKCVLYKFSMPEGQHPQEEANLTLETKDTPIFFCTFDKKSVHDIFNIMTNIAKSIIEGKEREILPPIYSITYDKEERIRTYSLDDFLNKFDESTKIWRVGFEFQKKGEITNIVINISYRANLASLFLSNVLVESTKKEIVTIIPEMVRGLVSKTKNKHSWCHRWQFEATVQLLAVITILVLSYIITKKLTPYFEQNIKPYSFVACLIILSNLWTYLSRLLFNAFYKIYPVVEIINKPKNKILPTIFIGVIGSIFASAFLYGLFLIWKLLS